jgi:superkiller protein 3
MGTLLVDEGLIDAALSEILSMPLERRHELDPERDVDRLLVRYHLAQVCSMHLLHCLQY